MFSITPRTGTRTWRNISRPRRATVMLTSCGMVTMTAPDNGAVCDSVIWASPVPGGKSTSR